MVRFRIRAGERVDAIVFWIMAVCVDTIKPDLARSIPTIESGHV